MVIKRKSPFGFTLIELLLVIVILGVLATAGLAMMQRNAVSTKVDKAAQQMQILMEAATAYYIDNGCWPNNSIASTQSTICPPSAQSQYQVTCDSATPPSFDAYIPKGLDKDPWGHRYTCEPEFQKGKKFSVFINNLPSSFITSQLVDKLPNAQYSSIQPDWVQADIATPLSTASQDFVVAAIGVTGYLQNNDTFIKNIGSLNFSCPPTWTGKIVATPLAYNNINDYGYKRPWYYSRCVNSPLASSFINLSANLSCTSNTDTNNITHYSCGTQAIDFYSYRPDQLCTFVDTDEEIAIGEVSFFYMALCTPPNPNSGLPSNAPPNAPNIKLF